LQQLEQLALAHPGHTVLSLGGPLGAGAFSETEGAAPESPEQPQDTALASLGGQASNGATLSLNAWISNSAEQRGTPNPTPRHEPWPQKQEGTYRAGAQ